MCCSKLSARADWQRPEADRGGELGFRHEKLSPGTAAAQRLLTDVFSVQESVNVGRKHLMQGKTGFISVGYHTVKPY